MRLALVVVLVVAAIAVPATAQELVVVDCAVESLQEAIDAGGDEVTFTGDCSERIRIARSLSLIAVGTARIVPDGGTALTVLGTDTTVLVEGVTIEGASDSGVVVEAGASLEFNNGIISGNTARRGGGIIVDENASAIVYATTISDNQATDGGAAYVAGNLDIRDSQLLSNQATSHGGAIWTVGATTASNSEIRFSFAEERGGGIHVEDGTVTLEDVTVRENSAGSDGGGIHLFGGTVDIIRGSLVANDAGDDGGGVENDGATVVLSDVRISNNQAADDGGAIKNDDGGTVTIVNALIAENVAGELGGGVYTEAQATTTIADSFLYFNFADGGGGLAVVDGGSLELADSIVEKNTATSGGGVSASSASFVLIERSSISRNEAGGILSVDGAGVWIFNTTVAQNLGAPGLSFATTANAIVRHVTVTGNTAGGISNGEDSEVVPVADSIVVDNGAENCAGPVNAGLRNILGDGCAVGDSSIDAGGMTVAEIGLEPLIDDQGRMSYHAVHAGSPAIDLGTECLDNTPDQLGVRRGSPCTAGAIEYVPPPPVTTTSTAAPTTTTTAPPETTTTINADIEALDEPATPEGGAPVGAIVIAVIVVVGLVYGIIRYRSETEAPR